jgi:hypothetical protein
VCNHTGLMLDNPSHLLGVEARVSILLAYPLGRGSGAAEVRHTVDLVARVARG